MPYVHSASFDCAKAKTKIDKLVCGDPKLSDLDDKLTALYNQVLAKSPVPEDTKEQQREWRETRVKMPTVYSRFIRVEFLICKCSLGSRHPPR
jgi:uncharacterized protein